LSSVMVMDGQGGGIGKAIIKKLRDSFGEEIKILALGTNSVATSQMMKAGANRGATGENAIISMAYEAVKQLRGEAGERQVSGAEVALTHNVGGIGQYCFVNIYKR